jgi:hypothetical protein
MLEMLLNISGIKEQEKESKHTTKKREKEMEKYLMRVKE